MLQTPLAAKCVFLPGTMLAMLDVMVPDQGLIDQLGKLGVVGIMAVAVVMLWRKLEKKETEMAAALAKKDAELAARDALLMENYKQMAGALASNNSLMCKMSETLDRMQDTLDKITTVRAQVGHNRIERSDR